MHRSKNFYYLCIAKANEPPRRAARQHTWGAFSILFIACPHPPIPAVSAVRPSSLRRLRSASPTADHSTDPTKRKTDDCTTLRGRPPSGHSIPHRHQTCRAEEFIVAHITGKPVPSATETNSGIGRARPSLQHGFRQRLHPRLRSVPPPPMLSYFGPGRLADLSAAAYSVPQPSLTPIPLRYIPVCPGSTTLALLRIPQDSRTVLRPQRCSLRSPVCKEFTRLSGHPGVRSLYNEHIKDSKIKAVSNSLPPSQTAGPLRSSRQTVGIYIT